MKLLETQAFPVHPNTLQGVLTNQTLTDLPYGIVHADTDTSLTIDYTDGRTLTLTLTAGEDVVLVGDIATISTTADVKVS